MKNKVTLIDYMGSDKLHSLSAWASTFLELGIDMPDNIYDRVDVIVDYIVNNGTKKRSIEGLLDYLATNEHTSPFRMSAFVFTMTTDIATHIQKLKHRVILEAENGESARYKELQEDKFYLPEDWKGIKTLPHTGDIIEDHWGRYEGLDWYELLEEYSKIGNHLYHKALEQITPILGKKRAKETARYFKTYNSQINTVNKFSFDGIIQLYHKRSDKSVVQDEIADIVLGMVDEIRNIPNNPFEYSLKAFFPNGL